MLQIQTTSKFRKDYKRIKKRGLDIYLLKEVLDKLCARETLDLKYKDHADLFNM
ncbi:type II toxin-antitoxin system YafQ family toxin [Mageeibacillus indolicus]|uniref:type II toxin-antitoxin system RelE/ParE family toxin n=1 Tax=Mageeibacillus indolicus TaxID=884684 RepID=UPI0009DAA72A